MTSNPKKNLILISESLSDIERIVIETDEENPIPICVIENGEFHITSGYRVRFKPAY